jgi:hypothetical protein
MQQYKQCLKAVAEELKQPQLPAYCTKATLRVAASDANSTVAQLTGVSGSATPVTAAADALLRSSRAPQTATEGVRDTSHCSSATRDNRHAPTAAATLSANQSAQADRDSSEPSFSLSRSARDKLQTQQRLQDELTDELLDMGQELKASTLAMQNAIRFRGKLLDDAEVSLEHSTANAQSVASKAKQQYRQSSWNFCQTCLLMFAMAAIFCIMIIYIKLTSMVGLKGR